jgi:hypothetical protein
VGSGQRAGVALTRESIRDFTEDAVEVKEFTFKAAPFLVR